MDMFEDIRDMVLCELDEIRKSSKLTKDCLDAIYKMVDIIKDIDEIEEKGGEERYSRGMNNNGYSGRMYRGTLKYDGESYDGYRNGDSYGRRYGYTRGDSKAEIVEKLENLMYNARDEHDKDAIKRLIDQMK